MRWWAITFSDRVDLFGLHCRLLTWDTVVRKMLQIIITWRPKGPNARWKARLNEIKSVLVPPDAQSTAIKTCCLARNQSNTNRFPYLLDHSGQVIASHLIKGKVPKGYFLRVHGVRGLLVVPGVYVSPEVAQPHVVALVGQDVAWRVSKQTDVCVIWFSSLRNFFGFICKL